MKQTICDYCGRPIADDLRHKTIRIAEGPAAEVGFVIATELDFCDECAKRIGVPETTFKRGMMDPVLERQSKEE